MVQNMTGPSKQDFIGTYGQAITRLNTSPNEREFQHQAVLALVRSGSLDLAISEYARYDLSSVRHHEDIMALEGRLFKDLYIRALWRGDYAGAKSYAQQSAHKYEDAFQDTQGFYSGVNAATMALMADMPEEIISARVKAIIELLPDAQQLTPEDHYFVEATRAECTLMLGEQETAKRSLQKARAFDPQNYAAHASTIKQFELILDKQSKDKNWLADFRPPRPLHYAGHIWTDSHPVSDELALKISDFIQQHDIGFAYGALAAGADITFAEALLQEGAELNVILPESIEDFLARSVEPYGADWVSRFNACLEQAHSVTCLPEINDGEDYVRHGLAGHMAMGQAILRSEHLAVSACQLLILNPRRTGSLTALHGKDWTEAGLSQHIINLGSEMKLGKPRNTTRQTIDVIGRTSSDKSAQKFDSFSHAMSVILNSPKDKSAMWGLHFDLPGAEQELDIIISKNLAGSILVTEPIASYAALKHPNDYIITLAGTSPNIAQNPIRIYTLQPLV